METYQISKTSDQIIKIQIDETYLLQNCGDISIDFESEFSTDFEIFFENGKPQLRQNGNIESIFDESHIWQHFNYEIYKSLIEIEPLLNNDENPY